MYENVYQHGMQAMETEKVAGISAHRPSILENLRSKKDGLEAQLAKVNEAIAALEKNPEVERILTLVGKAY